MKKTVKDKLKAAFAHFLLSAGLFSVFLYIVFRIWYPAPYFESNGGWPVMRLLMFVDLGLGPLCTLVIFKVGKPGLKFDMAVVFSVQFIALIYGANVLYTAKPLFLVFAIDRFVVVSETDVDLSKLENKQLLEGRLEGPITVIALLPTDPDEREKLLFETIAGTPDIDSRPEFYSNYKNDFMSVVDAARDNNFYLSRSNEIRAKIELFLKEQNVDLKSVFFYPLQGKKKDLLLALYRKDGSVLGGINVDPWEER